MVGIYKITNPAGRIYIGQSKMIEHRWYRYKIISSSLKRQRIIYSSLIKYGSENHKFEIITQLPDDVSNHILNMYEEFCISQYREAGIELMNLNGGGNRNEDLSEETREKLRISATGKKYWLGRKHTDETKEKIRIGNTGKIFTSERLRNMSIGNTGKISPRKGAILSDETRRRISEGHLGKKLSEEHKEAIRTSVIKAKSKWK